MGTLNKYFKRVGDFYTEASFHFQLRFVNTERHKHLVRAQRLLFCPWKKFVVVSSKEAYEKIHPSKCPFTSKISDSDHFSLIVDTQILRDFGYGAAPFRDYTKLDHERMCEFHSGVKTGPFSDEVIDLMATSVREGTDESLNRVRVAVFNEVASRWGIDPENGYEKIRGLFEEMLRIRAKSTIGQALRWPQYLHTRRQILKYMGGHYDVLHSVSGMYKHQARIVNALRSVAPNYPKNENEFFIDVYPPVVSRLVYITNDLTDLNGLISEKVKKGTFIYVDLIQIHQQTRQSKDTFGLDGICRATSFFQNTVQRVIDRLHAS